VQLVAAVGLVGAAFGASLMAHSAGIVVVVVLVEVAVSVAVGR
jgi:hypothetical protein